MVNIIVILADVNISILFINIPPSLRDNTAIGFENTVSGDIQHIFKFCFYWLAE